MRSYHYILWLVTALFCNTLYGGSPKKVREYIDARNWNFIENQGQLIDPNVFLKSNIKFYGHQGGNFIFCKPGEISFIFTKSKGEEKQVFESSGKSTWPPFLNELSGNEEIKTITTNHADLIFINSNPNINVFATAKQKYYENFYFSNNPQKGITNVSTYKTITYKSIYRNIDFIVHAIRGGIKYEFVINPGGNVNDIQMQWNGLQKIMITQNGGISYKFTIGSMQENKPVCYQGTRNIKGNFCIRNGKVGFNVGNYNKSKPFIIDPTIQWGTYIGTNLDDEASSIAIDKKNNICIAGYTRSTSGIATFGAYQTSAETNNENAFLAKFDAKGEIQWATYYGGNGYEFVSNNCLAVDSLGDIFMTGITNSTDIATTGVYQSIYGGGDQDAFLVKFDGNGIRKWATFFGGPDKDYGRGISLDQSENIYLTGNTFSKIGIATNGHFQSTFGGGSMYGDAFLAKFSNNGALQWASYYGGNKDEFGSAIAIDITGNIYLTGLTNSLYGIATTGTFQPVLVNDSTNEENGFLVKFNSNGSRQWATYYEGNIRSVITDIILDSYGNVVLTGWTTSDSGIATIGAYQSSLAGGVDGFITEFNNNGVRQWSTYFGARNDDFISGVAKDIFDNIYVTGNTTSDSGIASYGSYQTKNGSGNPGIGEDAFLGKFSKDGKIIWSTYYGGSSNDFGEGVVTDGSGNIYITGRTFSNEGISTSQSYQEFFGGDVDAFLTKFGNNNDVGIVSLISPSFNNCNNSIPIMFRLKNYGQNQLDSIKIFLTLNKKLLAIYSFHQKLLTDSFATINLGYFIFPEGSDTLKIWGTYPNGFYESFPFNDTLLTVINVSKPPKASFIIQPDKYLFVNKSISFQNTSSNSINSLWTFGNQDSSKLKSPVYTYSDTGYFKVMLVSIGNIACSNDTIYQNIEINSTDAKTYIPNAFTPNGDGIDDVFDISGIGINSYSCDVFTRWGEHIFHSSTDLNVPIVDESKLNPGAGWDGYFKGTKAPAGRYLYQFEIIDLQNVTHKFKGFVILIR